MDPPPDCSTCYMKAEESAVKTSTSRRNSDTGEYLDLTKKKKSFDSSRRPSDEAVRSVRSSAVIAYSANKNNTVPVFSELAPNTDLNLAPSNWLRKTVGLRPETVLPGSRYSASPSQPFSGFNMANSHLGCVGKVDVVSDAENIKQLLMMPYSKADVSLAIHRIGRTLMIENFDIKKHSGEESDWAWFRTFYQQLVEQQGSNKLSKKKSPSSQHERLMLSKFLYYSICKDSFNKIEDTSDGADLGSHDVQVTEDEAETESRIKLVEIDEPKELSGETESEKIREVSDVQNEDAKFSQVVMPERRWRYWTPNESSQARSPSDEAFERNILWTFEDLQMMLGTNMPIFGGGKYPAVSLRLRDSNKPINILTGIDYWLDNLICNVPELVMCFHVDGIVRNYERITTEDIPKLEHSSFSPQVIKDIAQNILSFLKSNCTKEGHTYWLFKGSGDDVVKLYDLTTLYNATPSDESSSDKSVQQNPYIFSVAMLLYKTAISLMQSHDQCDHYVTVKKLLGQCIALLDHSKYQYIVSSAICMLSTLCLPEPCLDKSDKENQQAAKDNESQSVDRNMCDTCTSHLDADLARTRKSSEGPRNAEIASIPSVRDLSIPEKFPSTAKSFDLMQSSPSRARKAQVNASKDIAAQVEDGCYATLSHIVSGLEVLLQAPKQVWRQNLLQQLTRNSSLAYFRLAEQANELGKFGRSLRRAKLALQSYETYDFLNAGGTVSHASDDPSRVIPPDFHLLLPRLLSLCGHVHVGIVQDIRQHGAVSLAHREEFTSFTEDDLKIRDALNNIMESGTEGKYSSLTQISSEFGQGLKACANCFKAALDSMDGIATSETTDLNPKPVTTTRDVKPKSKIKSKKVSEVSNSESQQSGDSVETLRTTLIRCHGDAVNEVGALSLNHAIEHLGEHASDDTDSSAQKMWEAWNEAGAYFETAYNEFIRVNDFVNQALVLSNMGRLMRISAQFYSNTEDGQLSRQERKCYNSAIDKYLKALGLLVAKDKRGCLIQSYCGVSTHLSVHDNISLELSSCYFSMAQILQDNPPLGEDARKEAEKEVISLLDKSLKYCKEIWENTTKHSVALHRQAKIHHRLASLHHNSYRNCSDGHKCKQLVSLAEKHYSKSASVLSELGHTTELIRVQLERLGLKEQHISNTGSNNVKIKLLIAGVEVLCELIPPLRTIENSTEISKKTPGGSTKDAKEDTSLKDITEICTLLPILTMILQSFLLTLVKTTANSARNEILDFKNVKLDGKTVQQVLKDLCSRTLRSLQPIKAAEKSGAVSSPVDFAKIHKNIGLVVQALSDVHDTIIS